MNKGSAAGGKLLSEDRIMIPAKAAVAAATGLFRAVGCSAQVAREVAEHLVEADQCGVESHGIVRVIQYVREFRDGSLDPTARPKLQPEAPNRLRLDAGGGIGIPAMRQAHEAAADMALEAGMAAVAVVGAGHTGRLGAFAEAAARKGCLSITLGGGNRERWRMVAPYGGTQALLPTNPYCIAMPGGARGPVVIDFATSQLAGGWIYAARAAGTELPEGMIIERNGQPSRNPQDYFDGGAILPKGGPMGYGLALMAELVGEAMLGPVTSGEINWLILMLDCTNYRAGSALQAAAEDILTELRESPPAPGHDRVRVPGERERDWLQDRKERPLRIPAPIWSQITALCGELGVAVPG